MATMFGMGALKGLLVTLKVLGRKPFTSEYPENREGIKLSARFRGNTFVWYESRCTGNGACAKACPIGIIRIVTHPTMHPQVGSDWQLDRFDIDTGRCMFCALCVEACPYDALFMGPEFERARFTRNALLITKEDLNAYPKKPTQYLRPQLERKGYTGVNGQPDEIDEHEVGRWSL